MLPQLYETFLRNLWDLRDRVIPVRKDTCEAMALLWTLDIHPDILYVDASHDKASVCKDVTAAVNLFPEAKILGDDWKCPTVKEGLFQALTGLGLYDSLRNDGFLWWLAK